MTYSFCAALPVPVGAIDLERDVVFRLVSFLNLLDITISSVIDFAIRDSLDRKSTRLNSSHWE